MNILGTMYAMDEKHIDILRSTLASNPPPLGVLSRGSVLCMDMDETDNRLEDEFPYHCQKATLLCPPPAAMYKEIDGDTEGFIQEYNEYLEYDNSVQDFIASMLLFLHIGGNIILYTPAYLDDDCIWMNTLMLFFFTRYGITIGTSETNVFSYDPSYDGVIADLLFKLGYINVFDYVYSSSYMSLDVQEKALMELAPYCGPDETPMDMYYYIKNSLSKYGTPLIKPAVVFEK